MIRIYKKKSHLVGTSIQSSMHHGCSHYPGLVWRVRTLHSGAWDDSTLTCIRETRGEDETDAMQQPKSRRTYYCTHWCCVFHWHYPLRSSEVPQPPHRHHHPLLKPKPISNVTSLNFWPRCSTRRYLCSLSRRCPTNQYRLQMSSS